MRNGFGIDVSGHISSLTRRMSYKTQTSTHIYFCDSARTVELIACTPHGARIWTDMRWCASRQCVRREQAWRRRALIEESRALGQILLSIGLSTLCGALGRAARRCVGHKMSLDEASWTRSFAKVKKRILGVLLHSCSVTFSPLLSTFFILL